MTLSLEQQIINHLLVAHRAAFSPDFPAWLLANPHIWKAFSNEVFTVRAKGFAHYSARTICEVLRHHSALYEVGGPWKIDNDRIPDMARLFGLRHPTLAGMFHTRVSPARAVVLSVRRTEVPA